MLSWLQVDIATSDDAYRVVIEIQLDDRIVWQPRSLSDRDIM
jgi:hypothetical protein